MKHYILRLISKATAPLFGDIVALHKGRRHLFEEPLIKDSQKNKTNQELNKPLNAVFKAAEDGGINLKVPHVPDVGGFRLGLNGFNPALLAEGIQTRFGSDKFWYRNRNKKINRYLKYMTARLLVVQTKIPKDQGLSLSYGQMSPQVIWDRFFRFMHRSNAFMVAIIQSLDRNYYRERHQLHIRKTMAQINDLRGYHKRFKKAEDFYNHLAYYIKFRRVYIPKAIGKERPLGVPAFPWRVYLRMWLLPLQILIDPGTFQHGVVPGRGTWTALNRLDIDLPQSRNIWEVDFQGFFPSVQSEYVSHLFTPSPEFIQDWIRRNNESKPIWGKVASGSKLTKELLVTENSLATLSLEIQMRNPIKWVQERKYFPDLEMTIERKVAQTPKFVETAKAVIQEVQDYIKYGSLPATVAGAPIYYENPEDLLWAQQSASTYLAEGVVVSPTSQLMAEMHQHTPAMSKGKPYIASGLPQGSPISPYLSASHLARVWKEIGHKWPSVKLVFYVDDGVFYSDNDIEFSLFLQEAPGEFRKYNLTFAQDKCQVVKQHGVELVKEFKFLGAMISPTLGLLRTQTRKGNSLDYTFGGINELSEALRSRLGDATFLGRTLQGQANIDFVYLYIFFLNKIESLPESLKAQYWSRGLFKIDPYSRKVIKRFLQLLADNRDLPTSKQTLLDYKAWESQGKELLNGSSIKAELRNLLDKMGDRSIPKLGKPFGGVILSRMYTGSKQIPTPDTPTGSQDFVYRTSPGSIGHVLATRLGKAVNLFNGSSYATGQYLSIASSLAGRPGKTVLTAVKVPKGFKQNPFAKVTGVAQKDTLGMAARVSGKALLGFEHQYLYPEMQSEVIWTHDSGDIGRRHSYGAAWG